MSGLPDDSGYTLQRLCSRAQASLLAENNKKGSTYAIYCICAVHTAHVQLETNARAALQPEWDVWSLSARCRLSSQACRRVCQCK